jgi:hypothetical protein
MKLVISRNNGVPIGIDIKIKEHWKTLVRCDRVGIETLGFNIQQQIPSYEDVRVRAKSLINVITRRGVPKKDFSW